MKFSFCISFLIVIFCIVPFPIFAQEEIQCGDGLVHDNSTGQCILRCGEGTTLEETPGEGQKCVKTVDFGQLEAIAVGIIGGLLATAFGIGWTIKTRKEEREREDLEIIQNYGNQISEIVNEEKNLETQLDCSLYAERYLDILNQMASLLEKHLIRRDVADYFENQFRYGINLWYWYKKNIEKVKDDKLDEFFSEGLENQNLIGQKRKKGFSKFVYLIKKFFKTKTDRSKILQINEDLKKLKQERWFFFRWWCNFEENEQMNKKEKYEKFKGKEGKNGLEILPDTMETDFADIPDENGMSKYEVVETIQKFGEILNNITNKEKNLYSKLDCSLYAEQYLDTLEQVATLYRKRVIPRKAADYFENKFAYGINLLEWYNYYVNPDDDKDNYSNETPDDDKENRWSDFIWFCQGADSSKNKITKFEDALNPLPDTMKYYKMLPEEEGLKPNEVLEIMRSYSKQLTDLSSKETRLQTQIDCSVYAEQYLDTLEEIAYLFNRQNLATDAVTYFENNFAYGRTLKEWYTQAVNGANEQEHRWDEFDNYCEKFENDEGVKGIHPFNIEAALPAAMLHYNDLPADLFKEKYAKTSNYKLNSDNAN